MKPRVLPKLTENTWGEGSLVIGYWPEFEYAWVAQWLSFPDATCEVISTTQEGLLDRLHKSGMHFVLEGE